jgi:hypothetical protein
MLIVIGFKENFFNILYQKKGLDFFGGYFIQPGKGYIHAKSPYCFL